MKILIIIFLFSISINSYSSESCINNLLKDKNKYQKIDYAGFTVNIFNSFKILYVKKPWRNKQKGIYYILTRETENICDNVTHVKLPVEKVISFSTTHIPALSYMNEEKKIVGVIGGKYIFNQKVQGLIAKKLITEFGSPPNIEKIISLKPDLILGYVMADPKIEGIVPILDLKMPLVLVSDHLTSGPLARAEWMIFISYFFEKEVEITKLYKVIKRNYLELSKKIKKMQKKKVLIGSNFNGVWSAPGGKSDLVKLVTDAGGNYIWKDNKSISTIYKSFETVLYTSRDVDYWLPQNLWKKFEDISKEDDRYKYLKAFKSKMIYNNNAKLNKNGGSDYWELGLMRPDLLLKDLVRIFHPEVLKDYKLEGFQKLK